MKQVELQPRGHRHRACTWLGLIACLLLIWAYPSVASNAAPIEFDEPGCPFKASSWYDSRFMQCGYLTVLQANEPEPIRIPVLRLSSLDGRQRARATVFLNGGPGGRGITELEAWRQHPLLQVSDLILFDPRGVGHSTPRMCPELAAHIMDALAADMTQQQEAAWRSGRVEECIAGLPASARDGRFSSDRTVDDLDAIRAALGYASLNILAVSYGTRIAQAYAAKYPATTGSLVLDSPIPALGSYYQDIPRTLDAAIESVFRQCEQQTACGSRYPDLRSDYQTLMARVERTPIVINIPAKYNHPATTFHLNARDLRLLIHQLLYGKEFIAAVPMLIHRLARENDLEALPLLLDIGIGMRVNSLDFAVYYLTLAPTEQAPMATSAEHGGLAFFDTDPSLFAMAREAGVVAPSDHAPAAMRARPLVLSGGMDPIASPHYGDRIAEAAAGKRLLFSGAGHGVSATVPCTGTLIAGFIANPEAALPSGCPGQADEIGFITDVALTSGIRDIAQRVTFQRSFVAVMPLAISMALYAATAVALALSAAMRFRARRASGPHRSGTRSPIVIHLALGLGLTAAWALAIYQMVTGPAPAIVVFGVPPLTGILLTLAFLAVACGLALALYRYGVQGRFRQLGWLDGVFLSAVMLGNAVLLGFLLRNGLAWII